MSDAEGELILTGWDKSSNDPLSFTYQEGNYIVFFHKNATTIQANPLPAMTENPMGETEAELTGEVSEEDSWEVYLYLRVTDF